MRNITRYLTIELYAQALIEKQEGRYIRLACALEYLKQRQAREQLY